MTRFLTIAAILLSVFHTAGFSLPIFGQGSCQQICSEHIPRFVETVTTTCCGTQEVTQSTQVDFCPMSDGPCQCGVRPADEHLPTQPVPMPQRDRDSMQMVRGPPTIVWVIELTAPKSIPARASQDAIRLGFTHNQMQAFLGVWRR